MNEFTDIRAMMQKYYSGYCKMCRELNIQPLPYSEFSLLEYHNIKTFYKKKRRK